MKKVLILVLSSQDIPYGKMIETSMSTWDSIGVDNVETVFYCGKPFKKNTDKIIYFDIPESYETLGYKMIAAFEWALANKEFDYLVRINSSCYCDKKQLIKYVETLPDENVFVGGIVAESEGNPVWCWGGLQYIISKDVIRKLVENKGDYDHTKMEDVGLSYLATKIGVSFMSGVGCSIDKTDNGWRCLSYGCPSIEFTEFDDVKILGHHFYRVKQDYNREKDAFIMYELLRVLK